MGLDYIIICTAVCTGSATILTETFKRYVTNKKTGYVPLAICIITAFVFNIGLIRAISGMEYANQYAVYLDWLLSGIIMTKGTNAVYELAKLKNKNSKGENI